MELMKKMLRWLRDNRLFAVALVAGNGAVVLFVISLSMEAEERAVSQQEEVRRVEEVLNRLEILEGIVLGPYEKTPTRSETLKAAGKEYVR